MCHLKVHANSHESTALQVLLHNLDTFKYDVRQAKTLFNSRNQQSLVEFATLLDVRLTKIQEELYNRWSGYCGAPGAISEQPTNESIEDAIKVLQPLLDRINSISTEERTGSIPQER